MAFIILVVCLTVAMIFWGVSLKSPGLAPSSPWLAFVSVLILALIVVLYSTGVVVYRPLP